MSNIKKELVLVKYTAYPGDYEIAESDSWKVQSSDYVVVSHPLDVEFEPLPSGDITADEVNKISIKIDDIRNEAINAIEKLETRKKELLSLTHDSDGAD